MWTLLKQEIMSGSGMRCTPGDNRL